MATMANDRVSPESRLGTDSHLSGLLVHWTKPIFELLSLVRISKFQANVDADISGLKMEKWIQQEFK